MDERVGRYELLGRLGAGGFATVYRARDPSLDGEVAIKLLADNWSVDPEVRSRFIQEAQLMRRLDNRRLVQVYDIGEHSDGRPYFVMRLASNGTLDDRLTAKWSAGAAVTTDELERLVDELVSCLSRVHGDSIVHRDLKPSNLLVEQEAGVDHGIATELLRAEEFLVLGDFGLARDTSNGASALTIAGGSGGFAAPEQYLPTGRPDARADLYAATAVLLYAATGEIPSRIDPAEATQSPRGAWTPELALAFRRGLARDPADRPATIDEWRAMMSSALNSSSRPVPMERSVSSSLKPDPRSASRGPSVPQPSTRALDENRFSDDELQDERSPRAAPRAPASRRRRWAFALSIVLVAAAAVLGGLRLVGSDDGPSISGPAEIEAGDSATFLAELDGSTGFRWVDSTGNEGSGEQFVIDAVVPGELTVEVTAIMPDGETSSNTMNVRVTESPGGPMILGPDTIRVGESAVYSVDDPNAETVEWLDDSGSVATGRYEIRPTSKGSFTFSAIVVREDGQRIGSTKVVDFVE